MKKRIAIVVAVVALALSLGAVYAWANTAKPACVPPAQPAMHLYIDTHDKADGTFPASITSEQLNAFYGGYAKAMASEGVVVIRTYVNPKAGKAFCITMAPSTDAVKRAHIKAGLMYSSITEVYGVAPSDLLLNE